MLAFRKSKKTERKVKTVEINTPFSRETHMKRLAPVQNTHALGCLSTVTVSFWPDASADLPHHIFSYFHIFPFMQVPSILGRYAFAINSVHKSLLKATENSRGYHFLSSFVYYPEHVPDQKQPFKQKNTHTTGTWHRHTTQNAAQFLVAMRTTPIDGRAPRSCRR